MTALGEERKADQKDKCRTKCNGYNRVKIATGGGESEDIKKKGEKFSPWQEK